MPEPHAKTEPHPDNEPGVYRLLDVDARESILRAYLVGERLEYWEGVRSQRTPLLTWSPLPNQSAGAHILDVALSKRYQLTADAVYCLRGLTHAA